MSIKISIVSTLFYSERYIDEFYERMQKSVLSVTPDYEFIFVNDGSPDNSALKVLSLQQNDPRIVLIDLSRNFGHHQAIVTGLQHSIGEYVFLIDSDLEEEPELFQVFWNTMNQEQKTDVVFGLQVKRKGGIFERISGRIFYRLVNLLSNFRYPSDTLTARLMKRNYVDAVLKFTEKTLDVWAVFVLAGFHQTGVRVMKGYKGSSMYTLSRKIRMSIEIITSVSHRPLYLIFIIGLIWLCISGASVLLIFIKKWMYGHQVEGWASIMASVWLIGGVIIFVLGWIGIYLSKIFQEIKNRPLTIIKSITKAPSNER
jgi:putative glycosyltransferase